MAQATQSQRPYQARTPGNRSGGFFIEMTLLPPIVVILASIVMAAILSQVTISTSEQSSPSKSSSTIAPLFTPEIQYWDSKIKAWSEEWHLDPNLVATIMQIESCGNPSARSGVGAMGLFQVMPFHFNDNEDPYKPNINARRGLAYLKSALDARGGDPRLALAGYNGGITGAKKPESAWPSETIRYVYWGTGIYSDARNGKAASGRLDEWLGSGGASLCRQASDYLGIP